MLQHILSHSPNPPKDFSKMKKFNFRKVLDGLTASSPSGSSGGGSGGGSGAGGGSMHPGGTAGAAGTPRDEIQETLTSDYFQICKVRAVIFILFYHGNNKSYIVCGGSNMTSISLLLENCSGCIRTLK